MVVTRAVIVSILMIGLGFGFGATPASACHRTYDMCYVCEGDACELLGIAHDVALLGAVEEKSEALLEPQAQSVVGARLGSDREASFYLILQWDTDDHAAPPGQADVPFDISFTWGSNVGWQGDDEVSVRLTANDTSPQQYAFGFTAPRDEQAQIDYVITAFPGTPNEETLQGTMTLAKDDDHDVPGSLFQVFNDHWPWLLLLIALGILLGFALAKWLTLPATRPVPLAT